MAGKPAPGIRRHDRHARSNLRGAFLAILAFALYATHDVGVKTLGRYTRRSRSSLFSVLFRVSAGDRHAHARRDPPARSGRPPVVDGHANDRHPLYSVAGFLRISVLPLAQV